MNQIKHIFFDLDHTLWDFKKNSSLTFKFLLEKYNISIGLNRFLEIYMPINFSLWKLYRDEKISKEYLRHNRLKSAFEKLDLDISAETIDMMADDYVTHLPDHNFLVKGTLPVLDYLTTKYELHIITNGFTEVQRKKISNSNLDKYFSCIIDSETVGVKKPNSKVFKYALKAAGATQNESLMIGDNLEADIIGALDAGFSAIHFNNNNEPLHSHCKIITDLKSLSSIL